MADFDFRPFALEHVKISLVKASEAAFNNENPFSRARFSYEHRHGYALVSGEVAVAIRIEFALVSSFVIALVPKMG
ncbi:hypothetical protein CQJ32_11770 [Adlercreutzia equolifaciens subsp. celatus]|uniref:Uncharacterized protein n=1 Tax=Adlercreutzia equolifaciens subsp. celatus TaxID=394340 RepID=A0A369NV69_9ACTN|nr:hypothetical protein C1850_10985 [Adlercreutzia equolifaciens subsp. celatus]RDC43020.1 hypothetical protein CQJ32_11770 [Adlercreutzia equolifaciens subsp. celatus]